MKKLFFSAVVLSFAAAAVLVSTTPAHAIILFADDFQDGNINGWVSSGTGSAGAVSHVPSTTPSGNPYGRVYTELGNSHTLTTTINTTNYSNIIFNLYRRTISFDNDDIYEIRWAKTGESFNVLESLAGEHPWEFKSWALPSDANNGSIDIQFYVASGNTVGFSRGDAGAFDDITVEGTPVPEPLSLLLLGGGLAGMIGLRRREN